jgi:hypothetical protein
MVISPFTRGQACLSMRARSSHAAADVWTKIPKTNLGSSVRPCFSHLKYSGSQQVQVCFSLDNSIFVVTLSLHVLSGATTIVSVWVRRVTGTPIHVRLSLSDIKVG